MLQEVKIYVFIICTACLFLLLREQVKLSIFISYFLASIFGVKTITCLIVGKCYYEVYYFLIFYTLINFLFVFYYQELKEWFPNLWKGIQNKTKKRKNNLLKKL